MFESVDAQTHRPTEGRRLDGNTISTACEPSASTRSYTKRAVLPQTMDKGLTFLNLGSIWIVLSM